MAEWEILSKNFKSPLFLDAVVHELTCVSCFLLSTDFPPLAF
jgi:hypothetical protein